MAAAPDRRAAAHGRRDRHARRRAARRRRRHRHRDAAQPERGRRQEGRPRHRRALEAVTDQRSSSHAGGGPARRRTQTVDALGLIARRPGALGAIRRHQPHRGRRRSPARSASRRQIGDVFWSQGAIATLTSGGAAVRQPRARQRPAVPAARRRPHAASRERASRASGSALRAEQVTYVDRLRVPLRFIIWVTCFDIARQVGRRPARQPPAAASTVSVDVGGVLVGSAHPVVVQSMTNTDTADADGTAIQVARLAHAGSQLVRDHGQHRGGRGGGPRDGPQGPRPGRRRADHRRLPLQRPPAARRSTRRRRRRSPSTGSTRATSGRSATTSTSRRSSGSPSRTTSRSGSGSTGARSTRQLLTELMDANARGRRAARRARRDDRGDARVGDALGRAGRGDRACATTGSSSRPRSRGVRDLVDVYRLLAGALATYPLHLGLTEAGMGDKGIVASTAGPGDPAQRGDRRHDPGLADARSPARRASARSRSPSRSSSRWACARSCPRSRPARAAAARPRTFFQEMARDIQAYLRTQMPVWRETHPGVEELRVAVMGCVVERPGREQARRHRDLPAGHVRGARSRRSSSTASSTGPSAATRSSPSSWPSSTTTSSAASRPPRRPDGPARTSRTFPSSSDAVAEHGRRRSEAPSVYTSRLNSNGRLLTWVTPTFSL